MAAISPLSALPIELLVEVFRSADSFQSATSLATTSRHLYGVWREHLPAIYNKIAPIAIPCHWALRGLLDDLGYLPQNTQVTTVDFVARVAQTSRIGDQVIKEYTARLAQRPHLDPQVPTTPSPTEQTRLIRAHYQLIGLLKLENDKQRDRIKGMDLKTLFLLSDFLCVFMSEAVNNDYLGFTLAESSIKPYRLQRELRAQRNKEFRRLYTHPYRPAHSTPYEQNGRHAWWCDIYQDIFKKMVTGRVFCDDEKADKSKVREDLWYDSSEE
ncbi:hypothetical protein BDW59DRAFT_145886 [Aspergillus cavernicola]|uniref:F-box domain-containing protein n=1 Tax=Aspergillus cavernicola TaxID=176166 RepID=A0ABR4IDB9_9EURO